MKLLFFILIVFISMTGMVFAQVPVTVNRSTVNSGGTVTLPAISGQGNINAATLSGAYSEIASYIDNSDYVSSIPAYMTVSSVSGTATPTSYNWPRFPGTIITTIQTPNVIISTNAPNVFTNTITATPVYNAPDHSAGFVTPLNQTYVITIAEDVGGGSGGAIIPSAILIGQSDPLESISRKNNSTIYRKMVGFSLVGNTNATLQSLAFVLSNSGTNGNNFQSLCLYRDADGQKQFDLNDVQIAATTNANGFAIFSGLTNSISTNSVTYFLAASFQPTNQTRNSFISASLNSQNIAAILAGTNTVIATSGGSILGKQYAFLDTTTAEDDAAAALLAAQINSSVSSATNAQAIAFNAQLATALNGLSNTVNISSSSKKSGFMDTVLPAAAAGAAGIGAAFTSDSLGKNPYSSEFKPVEKQ